MTSNASASRESAAGDPPTSQRRLTPAAGSFVPGGAGRRERERERGFPLGSASIRSERRRIRVGSEAGREKKPDPLTLPYPPPPVFFPLASATNFPPLVWTQIESKQRGDAQIARFDRGNPPQFPQIPYPKSANWPRPPRQEVRISRFWIWEGGLSLSLSWSEFSVIYA